MIYSTIDERIHPDTEIKRWYFENIQQADFCTFEEYYDSLFDMSRENYEVFHRDTYRNKYDIYSTSDLDLYVVAPLDRFAPAYSFDDSRELEEAIAMIDKAIEEEAKKEAYRSYSDKLVELYRTIQSDVSRYLDDFENCPLAAIEWNGKRYELDVNAMSTDNLLHLLSEELEEYMPWNGIEVETDYNAASDTTYIFEVEYADGDIISKTLVGWYAGEPNDKDTETFGNGNMTASYR